ncbi:zinc-binding alcohol dehydrogenase [Dactylosporangium salmoneum]|uniref:Zinc-binding alcohol dehydrogenase n=1 Tax=Dactylosporangium salmoneum TaxID=53361 RepID=A0ABP5SJX7_9ACTN
MTRPTLAPAAGATTLHCRRLFITGPGTIELLDEELPPLGEQEVYATAVLSGISHGTELAWLRGTAAALHRTWDPQRRLYLDGPGRAYPVAPGYESMARVAAVGPAVSGVRVGDLIAVDGPHASGHVLSERAATAGRLPDGVTPEQAVVMGLGTVGLLAAQQARLAGATVIGVDRYPLRVQAAETLGIAALLADGADIAAQVRNHVGPDGADAAIEASGSLNGLHEAIRCLRVGGRVATVASYHGDQTGLRLGEEYHRNRITIYSSMTVNNCPARTHPLWNRDRLDATARAQITDGRVRTDGLITHRIPFTDAPDAYQLLLNRPQDTIKVVLTYDH